MWGYSAVAMIVKNSCPEFTGAAPALRHAQRIGAGTHPATAAPAPARQATPAWHLAGRARNVSWTSGGHAGLNIPRFGTSGTALVGMAPGSTEHMAPHDHRPLLFLVYTSSLRPNFNTTLAAANTTFYLIHCALIMSI